MIHVATDREIEIVRRRRPPQGGTPFEGLVGEVLIYDVAVAGANLATTNAYLASF